MMRMGFLVLLLVGFLQGCTTVDDYLLGKDNTLKPKELKPLESKVKLTNSWAVPVGKPQSGSEYVKLKPVTSKNVVYAPSAFAVQAISKQDGHVQWSTPIKQGIVSGLVIADGYIALGTRDSSLVVLNQADGRLLWEAPLSGEMLAAPAISQKKIIAKTIDGKVYAFDSSGKSLWTAEHGSPSLVLKASSSPVIVGHLVLIGFSDGKLDAYELDNGRLAWQRSIAYAAGASDVERLVDIDADPIIQDNIAYIASYQGYIGALSLADGQFLWRKPASVYKNMLLKGNALYVTDSKDLLWSIDTRTGHVNWKQTALKSRGLTAPMSLGNRVVVGDKTGYLHIVDTQTGELLGRSQLAAGINLSPSVVGKHLYVLTDNGTLNALSVS